MIDEQKQQEQYKSQKAYLVALASCIRHIEPGSTRHTDLLWLIKHRATILKNRKLIEMMG